MEGNQTAEPIIMVVFPPLFLKKGQVNYFNSKGVKAANLGEGQLCKWHLEIHVVSFDHLKSHFFVKLESLHKMVLLSNYVYRTTICVVNLLEFEGRQARM